MKVDQKAVEVQVRTTLQQLWAELSEKLSDLVNPAIKYGGGTPSTQELLARTSRVVANQEAVEFDLLRVRQTLTRLTSEELTPETSDAIIDLRRKSESEQERLIETRGEIIELFQSLIQNPPVQGE